MLLPADDYNLSLALKMKLIIICGPIKQKMEFSWIRDPAEFDRISDPGSDLGIFSGPDPDPGYPHISSNTTLQLAVNE